MSAKFNLKKLAKKAQAKASMTKGIHIGERPPKKAKMTQDGTLEASSSKEKTPMKAAKAVKSVGSLNPMMSRIASISMAGGEEGTSVQLAAVLKL